MHALVSTVILSRHGSDLQVGAALDSVFEKWGKLNAVVQCAGIATATKVLSRKGTHPVELFAKAGPLLPFAS